MQQSKYVDENGYPINAPVPAGGNYVDENGIPLPDKASSPLLDRITQTAKGLATQKQYSDTNPDSLSARVAGFQSEMQKNPLIHALFPPQLNPATGHHDPYGAERNMAIPLPERFEEVPPVALQGLLPNKARAGVKFQQMQDAFGQKPLLSTAGVDPIVTRMQELEETGSTLPKFAKDYTDYPGPITYKAGRDFAKTAGRLSAAETSAMTEEMQMNVGKFAQAMKQANRDLAVKEGWGDVYDSAIKEYRQAKTLENAVDVARKYVPYIVSGAAGYGGGRYLLHRAVRDLTAP